MIRVLGPERDINTLTLRDLEAYVDHRETEGVERATIAKKIGTLRSALRHARKHVERGHRLFAATSS